MVHHKLIPRKLFPCGMSKYASYGRLHKPGFIKSDRPKPVALRGESSFLDLKRKFCKRNMHIVTFGIWSYNTISNAAKCLTFATVVQKLPQASCHGVLDHANGTQQQL